MTQAQLIERIIGELAEQIEHLQELDDEYIFAKSRVDYHRERAENPWDRYLCQSATVRMQELATEIDQTEQTLTVLHARLQMVVCSAAPSGKGLPTDKPAGHQRKTVHKSIPL